MTAESRLAEYSIFYIAALLFLSVGAITTIGLDWYGTLSIPAWAPGDTLVATIWCALFLLAAFSARAVWEHAPKDRMRLKTMGLYMGNGLLVLAWNYLFFGVHALTAALAAAALVLISVVALMLLAWHASKSAALLLAPYLAWMLFAVYFTYLVWALNP